MSDNSPYNIPRPPGRWRAIALALVMHVALFLFFWIGIRWQNETPLTVEAEIWDPQYKEAAPLPVPPPQPEPQPEPQPKIQPEPKPQPPKVIDEPKVEKPDIAQEKEKKRKQELEKKEQQEKQEKAEKEKAEKEKAEREKKEKLEAEKQKKLKEDKQKEEEAKKKADAEKQAADKKKAAADAKAAEARRQEDLKRMMGQATSATGGSGTAEKSQGPKGTPDYANKLRAKIRSNTIFDVPANLSGNPAGEYTVELFPDGTVRSVRTIKASGLPGFDDAVRQAVMKSQPFPADKDGKVPSSFTFTHYPKDQ
ncbi:cell envelope integrity protein TolA [Herbaspirillum sp. SJZ099]|uniref:cell envelope integrity protein TolA n=1 Tax=Herbaspirillum sp. SJZ099 TaxID=2572916 RepID=UPI0011A507B3|nr:cell envelope integrity protein TolA [Herbaspirillum sp. SJZ099]TWC62386.1 cell division and transport-associated protein TolA [Herbaspirillum sp. SJZ099]